MRLTERLFIIGLVVPLILIIDQWSKFWVLSKPDFGALECLDRAVACGRIEVSPLFDFSMVWNRGMSFGTLQSEGIMRWLLVAVTTLVALGFAIWMMRASTKLLVLALAILVAGAIGNVIDRIRFGAVVDFIDVSQAIPFFPWVFNVADSAITVGAGLLLLDQFLLWRQDAKNNADIDAGPKAQG